MRPIHVLSPGAADGHRPASRPASRRSFRSGALLASSRPQAETPRPPAGPAVVARVAAAVAGPGETIGTAGSSIDMRAKSLGTDRGSRTGEAPRA